MKTRFFYVALMLVAVVLFGCKKEQEVKNTEQEVTFQANQIQPNGDLKSTNAFDIKCSDIEPTHAHVVIEGVVYDPQVFRIDEKLYTQAIKLFPGDYTVTEFFLYEESGAFPGYDDADLIVMATPEVGSEYAVYTNPDLAFDFTVASFAKKQVAIEVLCFEAAKYDEFGFGWFEIGEIVLREQCFFGDFCMKHPDDYKESSYAKQSTGLQLDMPAIFKIMAYKDGVLVPNNDNFTNNTDVAGWGVGSPVCVQYPDNLNISNEQFKFELWILVKVGSEFEYKLFHTWTFIDNVMIPAGADGVVDFVLGSCNLSGTDLQLAPYQNLPLSCTLTVGDGSSPGAQGTYFDVTLSGIGAEFDIANGPAGVYCADQGHTIYVGSVHNMGVYSSLYPGAIPTAFMEPIAIANLDQANWLMNHLGNYPSATWADIQNALWKILDAQASFPHTGVPYNETLVGQMTLAATTNGDNYVPLPGGWAAVVFAVSGDVQIIFTIVDP